jgi:predicted lipid-binding transport protein (Tim44 family)
MDEQPQPFQPPAPVAPAMQQPSPSSNNRQGGLAGGVVSIVFGVIFIIAGVLFFHVGQIPASYARTAGQVTKETSGITNTGNNGGVHTVTTYTPTIQFSVSGNTYSFYGSPANNSPAYSVGQSVNVAYNPSDPSSSPKNASAGSGVGGLIGGVIFGLLMCVLGIWLIKRRSSPL